MAENSLASNVDEQIFECLDQENPQSFFLFAGAGSGKTRSLVSVLKRFQERYAHKFREKGQRVAIITYTNAARDEINRRLEFDPTFKVATIHSFSWDLIKPYTNDIRNWLATYLKNEIDKLQDEQARGRSGTKASSDRETKIASKIKRLDRLSSIRAFIYNPNGENLEKNSLNHYEVIRLTSDLLEKPLMRKIFIRKFPILLIDESQDTQKDLIATFLRIQQSHSNSFSLGLYGDTMQRIYTDGLPDMEENIPGSWLTPEIVVNHRSPHRVIRLINKIRSQVDGQDQIPSESAKEGIVRLFIKRCNDPLEKTKYELHVADAMSRITGDIEWQNEANGIKILTLEHHMAARRAGFANFFNSLDQVDNFKTGLRDGTLSGIPFFTDQILPLVKAHRSGDRFTVAQIVRTYSHLISGNSLRSSKKPLSEIQEVKASVDSIIALWEKDSNPILIDILGRVKEVDLFEIPDVMLPIVSRKNITSDGPELAMASTELEISAWEDALQSRFSELESYANYISDNSRYGTHQGIKGLEFPRVMVILDDEAARGFLFSYEKLFGAKSPSKADKANEKEGKETSIDRTRRLFYVICSRTEESLAIVAYTEEPDLVKRYVLEQEWFSEDEVIEG